MQKELLKHISVPRWKNTATYGGVGDLEPLNRSKND
jgi:hypothetical protein